MNKRLSLKIARRINTLLSEQLGEGVVPQRMLDDELYARDVLLVCDAMDDGELRKLSRMFRVALLEPADAPLVREPMSISSMLNSIFGHHPESDPEVMPAASRTRAIEPNSPMNANGPSGPASPIRPASRISPTSPTSPISPTSPTSPTSPVSWTRRLLHLGDRGTRPAK